jgi:hypothetical protein
MPSSFPSESPTACIPEIPLDAAGNVCYSTTKLSKTQTCAFDPDLFVLHTVTDTHVTFEVRHTLFTRGYPVPALNWLATYFKQYGGPACYKEEFLNFGESHFYTGECECGVAEVDIYAYSGSFNRNKDLAVIPSICNDYCNCVGRRCGWRVRIPCETGGQLVNSCTASRRMLQADQLLSNATKPSESVETATIERGPTAAPADHPKKECTSVWAYNYSTSLCLGHLNEGREGWTNRLNLHSKSEAMVMALHAHQVDCRDIGFPVGQLSVSYANGELLANFTVLDGFEIMDTNLHVGGKKRRLPRAKSSGSRSEIFDPFKFPLHHHDLDGVKSDTYYVEIDETRIHVAAHAVVCGDFASREAELEAAEKAYRESLRCLDEVEVANESFEDGISEGWTSGSLHKQLGGNLFLGGLGVESNAYLKEYTVPLDGTKHVQVDFTVLKFGVWHPEDEVYFRLWKLKIPVRDYETATTIDRKKKEGEGEEEVHVQSRSYTMRIPRAYLQVGGKLQIGFEIFWAGHMTPRNAASSKKSAGVDNLVLLARGEICHSVHDVPKAASGFSHGNVATTAKMVDSSSSHDENKPDLDDGYFCPAKHFPCRLESELEGSIGFGSDIQAQLAEVCIYSRAKGYITQCIPESDTDMLRYHDNGYCGRCSDGYKVQEDPGQ